MVHKLKVDPLYFQAILDGTKPFELRKNDRVFCVSDELLLRETEHTASEMRAGAKLKYTGRAVSVRVTYVLRGPVLGLQADWVILGIRRIH